MIHILVVEDNDNLRRGICDILESDGYAVVGADDGPSALDQYRIWCPDLIVLDLMLPGMEGGRVLQAVRRAGSFVPVLVLTAKHDEEDKVAALQAGADDYVTKPFGRRELSARIAALLRRTGPSSASGQEQPTYTVGDIVVDVRRHLVSRSGRPVSLAHKEFALLVALIRRRGAVATRAELLREVWNYEPDVASRTVDLHVLELRRKLGPDLAHGELIVTVRKVGYRLGREIAT